jgi:hypothetical protein
MMSNETKRPRDFDEFEVARTEFVPRMFVDTEITKSMGLEDQASTRVTELGVARQSQSRPP